MQPRISILTILSCLLLPLSSAMASGPFGATRARANSSGSTRSDEYVLDDGSSELSIGLNVGGNVAWINQFFVANGNNRIVDVKTAFGSPQNPTIAGVTENQTFKVYVWSDPNNDGNPSDAVLLCSGTGQAQAYAVGTDVVQPVSLNNCNIPGGNGTSFFIGASTNHPPNTFPAPEDLTNPMGRSWISASVDADGFDPNNLNGGVGLYPTEAIGFPGNWLVRADAVPEPATVLLLAAGTMLVLRRRRS